ncbi:MAG: P22 phage major capsid protein family protein [Bacillota bacterium]|nr:P22 phage major capsid protein family protein [Bacillota bacterium]
MSNTFLTAQEIARQALPVLKDNLVFPMLTYNDYSDDFANVGDTIQIRKPPVYEAKEFIDTVETQDIVEDKVLVTMDKIADVSVEVTAREMALSLESFSKQVIEPAAVAIAEKINRDGLALYKDIPYTAGTAGTTPGELGDIAAARKILNLNRAPVGSRYAVWDPEADTAFSVVPAIVNAEKSGSTLALQEGAIGRVQGLDNYMSQSVHYHEATLSGSDLKVESQVPEGSEALNIKGTGLSGRLNKGDILEIDDLSYTVTADSLEAATNKISEVPVYPKLPNLPADTPVTLVASHRANLAFHKNAFAFVTRPLEVARGAESYVTNFEGITLRVTFSYDAAVKKQLLSIDTLYGFKTLYPQLALRVLG